MHRSLTRSRISILVVALASYGLAAGCASPVTKNAPTVAAEPVPAAAAPVDGRVLGAADAPVTIIEFTDLQCPYCGQFARQTWPELRARYIDTGKVRFVSRDFPLPFHPYAMPAAIAARCAEQQGRYWEFREAVFRQQARLGSEPYAQIAASLGLDTAELEACRRAPEVRHAVESDVALGESNGIEATPSFAIGHRVDGKFQGEIVSGALSIEAFSQRIDALLKEPQQ